VQLTDFRSTCTMQLFSDLRSNVTSNILFSNECQKYICRFYVKYID